MKKIYYEKRGRRYYPVCEYDSDLLDSFPKGNHLVMCYPGGRSTIYKINPDYASMIAASRLAENKIVERMHEASTVRAPESSVPLTQEQSQAWQHLVEVFGENASRLTYASLRDIAEAGTDAMQQEANKLLKNPSVKMAWDHFMTVAALAIEEDL